MNKIESISREILEIIPMTDNEKLAFFEIMFGAEINPCNFMEIFEACKLSRKLTEIGLSNSIYMGRNCAQSQWKLDENAISNYVVYQRSKAIQEILS
jgi:hypothetical protein